MIETRLSPSLSPTTIARRWTRRGSSRSRPESSLGACVFFTHAPFWPVAPVVVLAKQSPADPALHRAAIQYRLHKELQVYRDEADKTRSTIEQMEKDAAADEYEIRQQVRASESLGLVHAD